MRDDAPVREQPADLVDAMLAAPAATAGTAEELDFADTQAVSVEAAERLILSEPGLPDLEAAVALVSAGLAKRVVLSGFQSWPGLLWRAYQLAESAGVVILPTVVRPGGRVDIVITRETTLHG